MDFKITELGLNLSGFYFSYCGEWWFVSLYVLLEIYARILEKTKVASGITSEEMIAVKGEAHNTIADQYTWDKLADSFVESYKKLGNKRKGWI